MNIPAHSTPPNTDTTNWASAAEVPHILLAEDDLEMRKMLAWSLRDNGFRVSECDHGDCLLRQLGLLDAPATASSFDLIISDIRMPGVTGLQVLESICDYASCPPVILITAFGDETTHANAAKLGAAATLDKPFDIDKLLVTVNQILPPARHSTNSNSASERESVPGPRPSSTSFPVSIKSRHGSVSKPVREHVLGLAAKLDRFDPLIQRLQVVIDQSDPEQYRKHRYMVTLTVIGPGKNLVARHDTDKGDAPQNVYQAVHLAFTTLSRRLERAHDKSGSRAGQVRN